MNQYFFPAWGAAILGLLSACSAEPSFLGEDAADSPSFYGSKAALILESANPDVLVLSSVEEGSMAVAASDYSPLPPVVVTPVASQKEAPLPDNSASARAKAYVQALYRGDGEAAWRYAFVPFNPQQSWWDSNTAKGALLMKAGSSEYFANEKRGVQRIEIREAAMATEQGMSMPLIAQITYGNGSHSQLHLRMVHEKGQWLVAQD